MLETVFMLVLIVNVGALAAWLSVGAFENVVHPYLNETYTGEVMDMLRMREDYPDAYRHVAYRRVRSPRVRKLLFRFIVAWEVTATLLLWAGTACLVMAALGTLAIDTALAMAMLGVLAFTATWCGFLVVGNWFCYWFGHEGGQNTHFQMTLWGLANMLMLMATALAI
ncbi:MAG: DUF2165 family protein [Roseovarius sp.]